MSHGSEAARDLRYGRRGGRWLPKREADEAKIAEWRAKQEALAKIHAQRDAQLRLDLDPTEGV